MTAVQQANLARGGPIVFGASLTFVFVQLFGQALFITIVIPYVIFFEGEQLDEDFVDELLDFGAESFQWGFYHSWLPTLIHAIALTMIVFYRGQARRTWIATLTGCLAAGVLFLIAWMFLLAREAAHRFTDEPAGIALAGGAILVAGALSGWLLSQVAKRLDRRAAAQNS